MSDGVTASAQHAPTGEIFSLPHLAEHAAELATGHTDARPTGPLRPLLDEFRQTRDAVRRAYASIEAVAREQRDLAPAEEWLLDNHHVVEEQLREIVEDLPAGYLVRLPRLADGPWAGCPRVYALALDFIAHTDARLDRENLLQYVQRYQAVAPLTIGELWAVPIMLRLGLVENVRRLAYQEAAARDERALADRWADRLFASARERASHAVVILAELATDGPPLSDGFVVELLKRVRDEDLPMGPVLAWIEDRMVEAGSSAEEVTRRERHRQAVNQVSVGNSITSMRLIGALDWTDFFEHSSLVEHELRVDPMGAYAGMDPVTRDAYRHQVERLAEGSRVPEVDVARRAVARAMAPSDPDVDVERRRHVGVFLVDAGRAALEAELGYRPSIGERVRRAMLARPAGVYLGSIGILLLLAVAGPVTIARADGVEPWLLTLLAILLFLPASEVAVSLVNLDITTILRPRVLPKLQFDQGIPDSCRTLVVVPTLLTGPEAVRKLVDDLEIRYLANQDPNLHFALLTDFPDAPQEELPTDAALLELAREGIEELDRRHAEARGGRFFLLHRTRLWNPSQGVWMGWERKRGKLEELNRLLRGDEGTSFVRVVGDQDGLRGIRYIITLDTDTQLPRDAARRLVGTIAHPLNRAYVDTRRRRVVAGYGLIQPRVSTTLVSAGRSFFSRIFTGNTGLDPYTTAVSDIYQDLFGEGNYYGKGIYDLEAFTATLIDRFPTDRLLSHDLIEGLFVRVGLASDVELLDDYPSHYAVYAGRQHRWVRGDWQLLPWLWSRVPSIDGWRPTDLPTIGRWKLFDNLRRSLLAPAILLLLVAGWTVLPGPAALWTAIALSALAFPIFAHVATAMARADDAGWTSYWRGFWGDLRTNLLRVLLGVTFLPDQALSMLDAIARTLARLVLTRRRLLEWETAAETERRADAMRGGGALWRRMWGATALTLVVLLVVVAFRPTVLPLALPFIVLWLLAPAVADRISRPIPPPTRQLVAEDARLVRRTARKTWRFFQTFVTAADNWLPPDNYQEDPRGVLARRTSPTNIGLYLLSVLAARDFSYLGLAELADRLDDTLTTLERLERYRGHLYNWYDTATLASLQPLYVSTVDSGNLAGHLLTLARGCDDVVRAPLVSPRLLHAFEDALDLLRELLTPTTASERPSSVDDLAEVLMRAGADPPRTLVVWRSLVGTLVTCAERLSSDIEALEAPKTAPAHTGPSVDTGDARYWAGEIAALARGTRDELDVLAPWATLLASDGLDDTVRSILRPAGDAEVPSLADLPGRCWEAIAALDDASTAPRGGPLRPVLGQAGTEGMDLPAVRAALVRAAECGTALIARLDGLAARSVAFAEGTDFGLVYDRNLRLFSIGFNVVTGQLDGSSYDLLASECRLASLVAIALGQVPQEHWFRLGRQLAPTRDGRALVSWSGTMFEYLMPLLVMRRYEGTLLDETYDAAVARQVEYGARRGVPWGISESAYNTLDLSLNYQYRAFGVPGLGLKSGLAEDLVVSPYSTVMALMVDPSAAVGNLRALATEGMDGRYGYFEAIDYTAARIPPGRRSVIVRSFMAHHQGMGLLAMDNVLHGEPMVRRFHADPRIRATELLLQERVPGPIELTAPRVDEAASQVATQADLGPTDRIARLDAPIPSTMLLSNGTYSVVLTASGAGTSTYRDLAITRWREDATLDRGGTFCYVRPLTEDGGEPSAAPPGPRVWSATFQPTLIRPDEYHVVYSPEAARYRRRDGEIETLTEVAVSPESHAEVRRVTLTNLGPATLALELTSFAEVALAPQAADLAHPAFGSLFVQTELIEEQGALLCTRRPRSASEARTWLVHVSAVEGEWSPRIEYETSRAAFLGRGRDAIAPVALERNARLSNSVGAVLDPALSLRRVATLRPGGRATISFTTAVAESRDLALELADTFADPRAVARTFELAWTDARVELRHLNLSAEQAHRFQDLAGSLIFDDPARRASADIVSRNVRGQSSLWPYGISGDRPILVVRVDDPSATELVHELLLAHEFWRLNNLSVDLVILNEDPGGYLQPLQELLLGMVRSSPAQGHLDQPGGVFVRRTDQIPEEDRTLLLAAARVVLLTSRGRLARQLARAGADARVALPAPRAPEPATARGTRSSSQESMPAFEPLDLQFSNGLGGFTPDGREYVIDLDPGKTTPAPWINVVANADFGFLVSESGSGFTWQGNSQANRITPWSNDAVSDPAGEALYLHDDATGQIWSPTPLPSPSGSPYRVRHGQGYSRFEHRAFGVESEITVFVPLEDPVKIRRLRLTNVSDRPRRLTTTLYAEWVLGTVRERAASHVVAEYDPAAGAIFARNRYADLLGRVAFLATSEPPAGATADRTAFLGRNGTRSSPAALSAGTLAWTLGAGIDPCGAIQVMVDLAAGETRELVFLLGEAQDEAHARELICAYHRPEAAGATLDAVVTWWDELLGTVRVSTPDCALDLMVNRWLPYQTLACRFWARSAFYQSGGAYGFRDQLQDVLALLFAAPRLAREQILRAAARQFPEGDVQHWWHPDTGQGVRTRCSDDLLWLPYVTAAYVTATGDAAVLDESVPFIESRPLEPHEHEVFGVPTVSATSATLYEHCLRALDRGTTEGPHGLPLIGNGDWNDGMNRVGEGGRGESVWVAWFLADVLNRFAPICDLRKDPERATHCRTTARRLGEVVDEQAWDGSWYRRAYFDDGTPLGSSSNDECTIDAIAQSWAVISGVGDPDRARTAMGSLEQHLVRGQDGLILLLTPSFDTGAQDPGYIKGYVPGVRENGGQYTHGALWAVLARAQLGDGTRAAELFGLLNPVNHARTPDEVERYRVEPYVVAADVYGASQHLGRGGWTWYTGSAGWMYRVAVESILGLRLLGDRFRVNPTIPNNWPRYELSYRCGGATYTIVVENPEGVSRGIRRVELDGSELPSGEIPILPDGRKHDVRVLLESADAASRDDCSHSEAGTRD